MRTITSLPALLLLLAACDGGGGTTPNEGPLSMGFANTRQRAEVAVGFAPVVGKAVRSRTAAAGWEFHLVTPAYADTAVVGAPAAGVEACFFPTAESQNGGPLSAPMCDKTKSDGKVSFTFPPGVRAATYRLPACVKGADGICTYPDTVVLTVLPRSPVSTRLKVGQVEHYGTGLNEPGRVTLPEDFFQAADGTPAPYRATGTGVLAALGDTVGSVAARQVQVALTAQAGDTASLALHSATKVLARASVKVAGRGESQGVVGFIVEVTFREVSVP